MIHEDTLIYDLETSTQGRSPDPTKDKLRLFGCYSYKTKKYYMLTNIADIQKVIQAHKNVIGFNVFQYDNVVLKHNGLHEHVDINNYGDGKIKFKINVDLYQIFKMRADSMKIKQGMLGDLLLSYSLDYITKTIGLTDGEEKIKGFDYKLLDKPYWTPEETEIIRAYTQRDIELTKKLYEWVEAYFDSFKEFLTAKDVETKKYLMCTTASFAYKAVCNKLGLEETYNHNTVETDIENEGGYVSYPAGESFHGTIRLLDFASLYPSIFHQCNLFSPADVGDVTAYTGGTLFKTQGRYKTDVIGKIETLLREFFEMRLVLKKQKDPREYSIKIIINTIYGIVNNAAFAQVYNPQGGSDCTYLGRQWIKYARKIFREHGYQVIYTDTDSIYILDHYNDVQKVLNIKQRIIDDIKTSVPFPYTKFDMSLDDEITDIWFFKGGGKQDEDTEMDAEDFINRTLGFMKKNYIYRTVDKKIVVKNLGVRKKSTSEIARKIFWSHIVPRIKEERIVKFPRTWFRNLIMQLIEQDLFVAKKRFQVQPANEYKLPNSIQAQIAAKYGPGIHFLIPNNKIGAGKGDTKYCTEDEFKVNNLRLEDIDLSGTWSELEYFIAKEQRVDLFSWGKPNGNV